MAKFRKKTVVIEAVQFTGVGDYEKILAWIRRCGDDWSITLKANYGSTSTVTVYTPKGKIVAYPGDWIIKGMMGKFYTCKRDIFEATYEAVPTDDEWMDGDDGQ